MWTTYIMYPYEYQYEYECEYDTKYTTSEVWVLESNHLELIFWVSEINMYDW